MQKSTPKKKTKKKNFPLNWGRKFAAIVAGFDDRYQSWFGIDFVNIPSSSLDLVFWVYQCWYFDTRCRPVVYLTKTGTYLPTGYSTVIIIRHRWGPEFDRLLFCYVVRQSPAPLFTLCFDQRQDRKPPKDRTGTPYGYTFTDNSSGSITSNPVFDRFFLRSK
jgi:hypothetical protein